MKKWERQILKGAVDIIATAIAANMPNIINRVSIGIAARKAKKPQAKTIELDESQFKIID